MSAAVLSAEPRRPRGVISYHGRQLAVGLEWSVAGDPSNAAGEARTYARQLKSTLYCVVRDRSDAGFGVGRLELGHRHGMGTAATMAVANLPGSWVALITVPEGVWFLLVREGRLIGSCDQLFPTLAAAVDHYESEAAAYPWERIYAPADAQIQGATPITLEDLLGHRRPEPLISLNAGKKRLLLAIAAVAVIALVYGAYSVYSYFEAERARQALEAQLQARRAAFAAQPPPWLSQPSPAAFVQACDAILSRLYRPEPGWDIDSLTCGVASPPRNGVLPATNELVGSVTWKRRYGNLDQLLEDYATALNARPSQFQQNADHVTFEERVKAQQLPKASAPAGPIEDTRLSLLSFRSTYRSDVAVQPATKPPTPADTPVPPPQPSTGLFGFSANAPTNPPSATALTRPPFWASAAFQLRTLLPPESWEPILTMPGVVLTRITLDPHQATWNIQGLAYDPRRV